VHPDRGSWGKLLKRSGNAAYNDTDHVKDLPVWSKSIDDMVSNLTNASRGITLTKTNMMALGLLQFGIRDMVDYEYNYSSTVTLHGVTYPKIKWQENTGLKVGNVTIPKQFANNATGGFDLGPMYHWAHRKGGGSPYLDLTDARTHWGVHHMTPEFMLTLELFGAYHYYAVRNLEEYLCGQNSISSPITNDCSIANSFANAQELRDWIFEQAKRSTTHFGENLIQTSTLQILLEYDGDDGFWDPTFNHWFRRDTGVSHGWGFMDVPFVSVREGQEFTGDLIRTSFTHHLTSGLDFFLSLRNPNINSTVGDLIDNCEGIVPIDIAADVISYIHTRTQRYGSQIHSESDLARTLYMADELGLSYKQTAMDLTGTPSVSDLPVDLNVVFGAQIETNPARQYYEVTASVAVAATAPLSDVIMTVKTSYYHSDDSGLWTSLNYHPDPEFFTLPAYDFGNCYVESGDCTVTSKNAAAILLGYHPDMDFLEVPESTRSRGALFPSPMLGWGYIPNAQFDATLTEPARVDYLTRQDLQWVTLPEFLNPLYYQYDGLASLAYKQAASDLHYLPNQLVDSVLTNVGFFSFFDGYCFETELMDPTCNREDGNRDAGLCLWYWQGPQNSP
jgi:hypothetical protein